MFGEQKNMFDLTGVKNWYLRNMGKLVLLFIVIVVVSVVFAYIPYLNFIISPIIRVLIIFLCIYILFPLSTRTLAAISMGAIVLAFIFTLVELDFIAQMLGDILYLLLVSIFINYVKAFIKDKKDL